MNRGRVLLGAVAWISTVQFFVTGAIVASRWSDPSYSYRLNTISSLGVTKCLNQGDLYICSPWHAAANVSWIIAGLCMLAGAVLTASVFPRDRIGRWGTWLFGVSGAGLTIVGANPDNLRGGLHGIGAVLAMVGGDIALILLGISLRRAGQWGRLAMAAPVFGAAGLIALPLMLVFQSSAEGALERVAAYPIIAFYILFGLAIVLTRPGSGGADSATRAAT